MQIQKDRVQVLLHDRGGFHDVWVLPHSSLEQLLHILEEGTATELVWHLQQMLSALALLLCQLEEEVAQALQSHIVTVETDARGEVGVGRPQLCVDQVVDGGLHLGGIILMNPGAHG